LLNHSLRVFVWGCILGRREELPFDREVLYVASLMHDIGLTPAFDGPRCFEVESATAGELLARKHGWDVDRCRVVGEAIRLHTSPFVDPESGAEAHLLEAATSLDVGGARLEEVAEEEVALVLEAAPREGFKSEFLGLVRAQAHAKPGCWADTALRSGLGDRILAAPFES
jgi:hypothetical protein